MIHLQSSLPLLIQLYLEVKSILLSTDGTKPTLSESDHAAFSLARCGIQNTQVLDC